MDEVVMSSGRLVAGVGVLLALAAVVFGGSALIAAKKPIGQGRRAAAVARVAGLIGAALGGVVVATSQSGIGTGQGRGGAILAIVLGAIGLVLAAMARARQGRSP